MMISLQPGSPEENAAASLLAVIADPKASQARLQEIVAEKKLATDARKVASEEQAKLEKTRADAVAALAKLTQERDEFEMMYEKKSKQLADQDVAMAKREAKINADERALADREATVADAKLMLKAREDAVAVRERSAKDTLESGQALQSEYQKKVSALQAAIA